jgi:hypothetical protein
MSRQRKPIRPRKTRKRQAKGSKRAAPPAAPVKIAPIATGGRPDRGWYSRQEMAEILGVSEVQFDRKYAKLAATDGVRTVDRRLWFHARKLFDAWMAEASRERTETQAAADAMLAAAVDSAAERYREAKARMAELDLAERLSGLVRLTAILQALGPAVASMRSMGARLVLQFGNGAGELFNESFADFQSTAEQVLRGLDAGRGDSPGGDLAVQRNLVSSAAAPADAQ